MKDTLTDRAGDIETLQKLKLDEDARLIHEMKEQDNYDEGVIEKAEPTRDGWSVTFDKGMTVHVPDKGIVPEEGKTIRVYGEGFGFRFHGIDIDGEEIFWQTPWERFSDRIKWLADYDRRQREEYAEHRDTLDSRYAELSRPVKDRIDRFRREDPTFRIKGEAYEMAACVDGDKIYKYIQVRADANGGDPAELLHEFEQLSPEEQHERIPDLDDGHSGNTWGGAMMIASRLLRGEPV